VGHRQDALALTVVFVDARGIVVLIAKEACLARCHRHVVLHERTLAFRRVSQFLSSNCLHLFSTIENSYVTKSCRFLPFVGAQIYLIEVSCLSDLLSRTAISVDRCIEVSTILDGHSISASASTL